MATLLSIYQSQFLVFVLIFTRVSGLVMTAPVLGLRSAPLQVRAVLAVTLAVLITPFHWQAASVMSENMLELMLLLSQEFLLGLSLGLCVYILFTGLQFSGQIMGQLSGMSLADVFDPAHDGSVPILSDLMDRVTLAVFVIIGGHRELMQVLLDTFRHMPPGNSSFGPSLVDAITQVTANSITLGVRAAAPAMVSLLLANLLLGLINRTLPQLNIIAVGFGLNVMILMLMVAASLGAIAWLFQDAAWETMDTARDAFESLVPK